MEISLIEEEAKIEEIKGYKTLKYKVKNNGKNMDKIPVYNQWLKLMKTEKGENGIISYCTKCYSFYYFENVRQKHSITTGNCDYYCFADFCEYCGELFYEGSICCLRKSFDMFYIYSYTLYFEDFCLCLVFIPITSLMWAFFCFFKILFSKRIKKSDDINNDDEGFFHEGCNFSFYIIFILFCAVYSLVFCVPYFLTIYFFQLFLMIKIKRQRDEDNANNIMRY